ncbi:hypothetical protein PYCC9005_003218 [Savitreella phatthalungensis]
MLTQQRGLEIKTASVSRLLKDLEVCKHEIETEQKRLETMTAGGSDEYEIRQQNRVLADAKQMLPEYQKRLAETVADLDKFTELCSQGDENPKSASEKISGEAIEAAKAASKRAHETLA